MSILLNRNNTDCSHGLQRRPIILKWAQQEGREQKTDQIIHRSKHTVLLGLSTWTARSTSNNAKNKTIYITTNHTYHSHKKSTNAERICNLVIFRCFHGRKLTIPKKKTLSENHINSTKSKPSAGQLKHIFSKRITTKKKHQMLIASRVMTIIYFVRLTNRFLLILIPYRHQISFRFEEHCGFTTMGCCCV